jgi:hypothetical protein
VSVIVSCQLSLYGCCSSSSICLFVSSHKCNRNLYNNWDHPTSTWETATTRFINNRQNNHNKCELYIKYDSVAISKARCKLRFERARFNDYLFKIKQSDTNRCPDCVDQIENTEHVLLHCPRYEAQRTLLANRLSEHNIPLSKKLLLGQLFNSNSIYSNRNKSFNPIELLAWTGDFINYIFKSKQFILS